MLILDRNWVKDSEYALFHDADHWTVSVRTDQPYFHDLWNFTVQVLVYTFILISMVDILKIQMIFFYR